MTQSHETIPTGYSVVEVDVGAAQELTRELTKQVRQLIGLPDLLVAAVGRQHPEFPLYFASLVDERTARLADAAHVAVTFDLGNGLFVPVVRDARTAERDRDQRAARGVPAAGGPGHLRRARSRRRQHRRHLHHDGQIVLAVPIVYPGHACVLALGAPQQRLSLRPDGTVGARAVAQIGLAYDHRLINGRDAALFLQAMQETLEAPESLVG